MPLVSALRKRDTGLKLEREYRMAERASCAPGYRPLSRAWQIKERMFAMNNANTDKKQRREAAGESEQPVEELIYRVSHQYANRG